jgi:hypothetical protein
MKKRFNINRVFKQRDKLFLALRPYIGANISGQVFKDLVEDIYPKLPDSVSHDAVFESARSLAGFVLERKTAAEFAWRVAGNISLLNAGTPVLSWTIQVRDEWIPIQILRVDAANKNYRAGYLFHCRALAGSSCPMIFEQFLSRASCAAISRTVGFNNTMPYTNGLHFTNLRMWVGVEAARSSDMPQFQQVDCSTAMQQHNKKLLAIRTRLQPCVQNFEHLCEHCEIGYDQCPAAIFPKRLEKKLCENCGETRYFDPSRESNLCMACLHAANTNKTAGI